MILFQSDEQQQDYEQLFIQTLENLGKAVDTDDLASHKHIKAFDATVMKQHFGDNITQDNNGCDTEASGADGDDIEMTQDESQTFICPITRVINLFIIIYSGCLFNYVELLSVTILPLIFFSYNF